MLYAESSAVLSWLLAEPRGLEIADELARSETVFSSSLTLIECDRTLLRARLLKHLTRQRETVLNRALVAASSHWAILAIDDKVVERARRPFGDEPIRTLDAIHLASFLEVRKAVPHLEMLTLDERIRRAAGSSGISCKP